MIFCREDEKIIHTCRETSQSLGLWHESGGTFISQTLNVHLGPYAIPVFSPASRL